MNFKKLKWTKFKTNAQQGRYIDGNKHTIKYLPLYIIMDYKLKQHWNTIINLLEWPKSQTLANSNPGILIRCRWEGRMVQLLCKKVCQFHKQLLHNITLHRCTVQSRNNVPWYLLKWGDNLCPRINQHLNFYRRFIHNIHTALKKKKKSVSLPTEIS